MGSVTILRNEIRKAKEVKGRSWNCLSRKREDKHPLCNKIRWEIILRKEYIKST